MIIIPSKEVVIITPPKTASTSLLTALKEKYPDLIHPHRHMEMDGLPREYTHFKKYGIMRDPVYRMMSLYNFLHEFDTQDPNKWDGHGAKLVESVTGRSFSDWVLENDYPFTQPFDDDGNYIAKYDVLHMKPEQMKSQFEYFRPDLCDIEIVLFQDVSRFAKKVFDVDLPHLRKSTQGLSQPHLTKEAYMKLYEHQKWDIEFFGVVLYNSGLKGLKYIGRCSRY